MDQGDDVPGKLALYYLLSVIVQIKTRAEVYVSHRDLGIHKKLPARPGQAVIMTLSI